MSTHYDHCKVAVLKQGWAALAVFKDEEGADVWPTAGLPKDGDVWSEAMVQEFTYSMQYGRVELLPFIEWTDATDAQNAALKANDEKVDATNPAKGGKYPRYMDKCPPPLVAIEPTLEPVRPRPEPEPAE